MHVGDWIFFKIMAFFKQKTAYEIDKKECNQYLDCKYYQNVNIINLHYENDGKSVKLVQPNNSFHYKKTK